MMLTYVCIWDPWNFVGTSTATQLSPTHHHHHHHHHGGHHIIITIFTLAAIPTITTPLLLVPKPPICCGPAAKITITTPILPLQCSSLATKITTNTSSTTTTMIKPSPHTPTSKTIGITTIGDAYRIKPVTALKNLPKSWFIGQTSGSTAIELWYQHDIINI